MRLPPILLILAFCISYLGLYRGNLAIFSGDDQKPAQVFPYSQELFPETDREALRKGIPFSSQEELSRLMEDYLS